MEEPCIPDLLGVLAPAGLEVNPKTASYYLGRDIVLSTVRPGCLPTA